MGESYELLLADELYNLYLSDLPRVMIPMMTWIMKRKPSKIQRSYTLCG